MFKILLAILFLIPTNGWCVTQWNKALPASGDNITSFPAAVTAQWSILDTLISNYKRGELITFKNSTTLTITLGEIVVSNSGGSLRLFLQDLGNTDITTANLDSGSSFSASTQYYVYAATSSSTASSSTYYISLNSSSPTGPTYYIKLGSFFTDGSGNVTATISNVNIVNTSLGSWSTSYSNNVSYQAATDGFIVAQGRAATNDAATFYIVSDSSSSPSTVRAKLYTTSSTTDLNATLTVPVKKGDYWKVVSTGNQYITGINWIPLGS